MPTPRSQLAILVFAGAMLVATAAVRVQRPLQHGGVEHQPITYRVDVNSASRDTMCLLPGVGPSIANQIINHRESSGPFATAADLESVKGIGAKKRAAIEPWIGFEDNTDN